MSSIKEHFINLDLPPRERWSFLVDYKFDMNELIGSYLKDFEGFEEIYEMVHLYEKYFNDDYLEEIKYIANLTFYSYSQVLVANLYYDILKLYFGCTAFAIKTEDSILHARNLDWHTDNNMLSKYTKIFNFQKGGKTIFKSIGWAGFIGVLSGVKPNNFSITLNAILSEDSSTPAKPISFLIRETLENANSFEEAKNTLESTNIVSDCLLLLSSSDNDMVVIERTPTRFETRSSKDSIIVTNDYKKLKNMGTNKLSFIQSTSCSRYDKTEELLNTNKPTNKEECLNILKDNNIKMNITVQQMVFDNKTGDILLKIK